MELLPGFGLQNQTGLTLHDANYNTNFLYRGNPTSTFQLNDKHCYSYLINGAVAAEQDGDGLAVSVSPSGSTNYSLPGVLTLGGNTNLATNVYYASSYAVSSLVNPNGATTSTTYDAWGRPATTTIADGAVTNYSYSYSPNTQTASVTDPSGTTRWTKTIVDGFGRTISVLKGYSSTTVSEVDTQYAPCGCSPPGKVSQVSEPYAPGGTPVWTTYTHDASGRMLTSTAPDGSVTQYSYQGNNTTVTDPAGNWKTYTKDAFGNLTVVTEPRPGGGTNYVTNYTYNGANQLTTVQLIRDGNTQTRSFTWSGMDLASATNPENGTVSYTYDGAHHVLTRTDAKGQVTQYGYDAYERLTSVAYPGSATPSVTYYYDSYGQSTNTWGRLAAVAFGGGCVANGSANAGYLYTYGYNPAGRVTAQGMQVTLNQSYPSDGDQCSSLTVNQSASYTWDNEGRMTSLVYPGNTNSLTYTYDSMGHQNGLTDSVTGMTASAAYGTAGEMDSMNFSVLPAQQISEGFTYNSLWQLTGISATEASYPYYSLMNMQYGYTAGHNNGRISSSTDSVLGQTVNYGYDSLNRLSTAQATNSAWGQSYSYDGFGNLTAKTVTAGSAMQFSASYNAANNQQSGLSYDANGNALSGPYGVSYGYDAENRINSVTGMTSGPSIYGYDPQNKRVMVQTGAGSSPIIYSSLFTFYSITGQMLSTFTITSSPYTGGSEGCPNQAESICASGPTPGYLYLAGKRLMVADRLGSQRGNGQAYYPWGEPMNSPAPTGDVEFATYWRDMVGQDYADQRYYNSNAGRFYTPDPSGRAAVDLKNPTSWNMYAYSNGDPVDFNDALGLLACNPDTLCAGDTSVSSASDYCTAMAPFAWMNYGAYYQMCNPANFSFYYPGPPGGGVGGGGSAAPSPGPDCNSIVAAVGFAGLSYSNALEIWTDGSLSGYSSDSTAAIIAALAAVTWQGESSFALNPTNNGNYGSGGNLLSVDYGPFQINQKYNPNPNSAVWGTNGAGQTFNGNPDANIAFGIQILEGLYNHYGNRAAGYYVGSPRTPNAQNRQATWNNWGASLTNLFGNTDCFPHQ